MFEKTAGLLTQNTVGENESKRADKAVICDIIEKARFVFFSEFISDMTEPERKAAVCGTLAEISSVLTRQGVAAGLVSSFIESLPKIQKSLFTDVDAAFMGDPAASNKTEVVIAYPGLFAVMVQRMAHELYLLGVPLIPRLMTEHAHSITGIDIHPGAAIGDYFFIDHGTGVVIGETTIIGSHVKIYQGVTLGALSTRGGQKLKGVKRHPTLENNVTVYSGASILGGETVIGEGVTVASSAFITKSVPAGMRVAVKNPELQFKDGVKKDKPCVELEQGEF